MSDVKKGYIVMMIGVMLCVTVIGSPVGLVFMAVGALMILAA